jgi:hypothetical protein
MSIHEADEKWTAARQALVEAETKLILAHGSARGLLRHLVEHEGPALPEYVRKAIERILAEFTDLDKLLPRLKAEEAKARNAWSELVAAEQERAAC